MTKVKIINHTNLSLLLMEFGDWIGKPYGELEDVVGEFLRLSGIQASPEQAAKIAGGLHNMMYSVVDDEFSWFARILRDAGLTVDYDPSDFCDHGYPLTESCSDCRNEKRFLDILNGDDED